MSGYLSNIGGGGQTWKDGKGLKPRLDGPLITTGGWYGLEIIRRWTSNNDNNKEPIFLKRGGANGRENDMHERELCLKKRGGNEERISSLNNMLVPKGMKHDHDLLRRHVYDNWRFGGINMERVIYDESGEGNVYQVKRVNFIYGGMVTMRNPGVEDFAAFTPLGWTIPMVDEGGYPIKAASADEAPTRATPLWEAQKTTVDNAEKKWIHEAMKQYIQHGKCTHLDHPLKEGSAHLLDGIIGCSAIIAETLEQTDLAKDLAGLVGKPIGDRKRRRGGPSAEHLTTQQKKQKKMIADRLFANSQNELKPNVSEFQHGNAVTRYIAGSRRINEDQRRRRWGMTMAPVKGGGSVEVFVGAGVVAN